MSTGSSGTSAPGFSSAVQTTEKDLASGNYLDAWKTALSTAGDFGTPSANTRSTDPLIQAMEFNVSALDPSAKWDQKSTTAFYDAFGQATGGYGSHAGKGGAFNATDLGKNPYGLWGNAADSTQGLEQQAQVDYQNNIAKGGAPQIGNYLGAKPSKNFAQKYGGTIAELATAIVAPELLPLVTAGVGVLQGENVGKALLGGAASFLGGPMIGGIVNGGLKGGWKGALEGGVAGGLGYGLGQLGNAAGGALGDASGVGTGIGAGVGGMAGKYGAGVLSHDFNSALNGSPARYAGQPSAGAAQAGNNPYVAAANGPANNFYSAGLANGNSGGGNGGGNFFSSGLAAAAGAHALDGGTMQGSSMDSTGQYNSQLGNSGAALNG